MLTGQPVHFAACVAVPVSAGINRVVEASWDAFDVQAIVLDHPRDQAFTQGTSVGFSSPKVLSWTSSARTLRVAASQPSYLVVNENFNTGWTASVDKHTLRPLRLDGWKQAWALPAGTDGIVTLKYLPDTTYRTNLLVGFAALAIVFVLALVPTRRRRQQRGADLKPKSLEPPTTSAGNRRLSRSAIGSASVLLLIGSAVVSLLGLWLGGYPGALILPVATGMFVAAIAFRQRSTIWRFSSSIWLVPGLLMAAAATEAAGIQLRDAGHAGPLVRALWGTYPQVLCLVVVARLIAAFVAKAPADAEQVNPPVSDSRISQIPL
jgi:arabinofuranan 3-O-arabinosyltransferase